MFRWENSGEIRVSFWLGCRPGGKYSQMSFGLRSGGKKTSKYWTGGIWAKWCKSHGDVPNNFEGLVTLIWISWGTWFDQQREKMSDSFQSSSLGPICYHHLLHVKHDLIRIPFPSPYRDVKNLGNLKTKLCLVSRKFVRRSLQDRLGLTFMLDNQSLNTTLSKPSPIDDLGSGEKRVGRIDLLANWLTDEKWLQNNFLQE